MAIAFGVDEVRVARREAEDMESGTSVLEKTMDCCPTVDGGFTVEFFFSSSGLVEESPTAEAVLASSETRKFFFWCAAWAAAII